MRAQEGGLEKTETQLVRVQQTVVRCFGRVDLHRVQDLVGSEIVVEIGVESVVFFYPSCRVEVKKIVVLDPNDRWCLESRYHLLTVV